jgi:hypothetical protein
MPIQYFTGLSAFTQSLNQLQNDDPEFEEKDDAQIASTTRSNTSSSCPRNWRGKERDYCEERMNRSLDLMRARCDVLIAWEFIHRVPIGGFLSDKVQALVEPFGPVEIRDRFHQAVDDPASGAGHDARLYRRRVAAGARNRRWPRAVLQRVRTRRAADAFRARRWRCDRCARERAGWRHARQGCTAAARVHCTRAASCPAKASGHAGALEPENTTGGQPWRSRQIIRRPRRSCAAQALAV